MEGLIEGAVLAVLVVLIFLRDIRATAISAIAIPLSAIPAFFFMSVAKPGNGAVETATGRSG